MVRKGSSKKVRSRHVVRKHSKKNSRKHRMGKSHAKKVSRSRRRTRTRRTNKRRSRRGGAQNNGNSKAITLREVLPNDIVLSEENVETFIEDITKEYEDQKEYDEMINICEDVTVKFFRFLITQDIDIKKICNEILKPILVNVLNETKINFPIKPNASNPQKIVNVTQPGGAMNQYERGRSSNRGPYGSSYRNRSESPLPRGPGSDARANRTSGFQRMLDTIGSVLPTTNLLDINNVITIFFLFITQQISVVTTGKQLNLTGGLVLFTEDQKGPIKIALLTCVNFMTIFAGMFVLEMMKQRQLQAEYQRRRDDEKHDIIMTEKKLLLQDEYAPNFSASQVRMILDATAASYRQGALNTRNSIYAVGANAHRLGPTSNNRVSQFVGGYGGEITYRTPY